MTRVDSPLEALNLTWIYTSSINRSLDAATWLKTTQELRGLGLHVELVTVGPTGRHEIDGVEVLCVSRPEIYIIRQLVFHTKVIGLILREWHTVDIVLFHQASAPWLMPLRLVRALMGTKRPLFAMDTRTLHMPPTDKQEFKDKVRKGVYELTNRLATYWADGELAITQRMAKVKGIPRKKLWGIWPSGADVERFAPAQSARRWPDSGDPIHLIYLGCLHHERNLVAFSEAVRQANAEGMSFVLWLVGDGTGRKDLENLATEMEGIIRVVPPIPNQQVPAMLAQAHIGVLPFPDEEKFRVSSPIKLFEYMASGLPILATRIVCHTDVVGDAAYVFWAENSNVPGLLAALRQAWLKRDSLQEMGRQAALAAHGWTWQESARKLKQALEYGASQGERANCLADKDCR